MVVHKQVSNIFGTSFLSNWDTFEKKKQTKFIKYYDKLVSSIYKIIIMQMCNDIENKQDLGSLSCSVCCTSLSCPHLAHCGTGYVELAIAF